MNNRARVPVYIDGELWGSLKNGFRMNNIESTSSQRTLVRGYLKMGMPVDFKGSIITPAHTVVEV
jgi:hypothetical protein